MEKILTAKPVIKELKQTLIEEINRFGLKPRLALLYPGSDPGAQYYVNSIMKNGKKFGIEVDLIDKKITDESVFIELVRSLSEDDSVDAIMVQKPLPETFDEKKVVNNIDPEKDVDALHPVNLGKMVLEEDSLKPCTPSAVIELMKYYDIKPENKNTVLVGRSSIVGKPLAMLLLKKEKYGNATITVCHSKTHNLSDYTKKADILIVAVGRENFVKPEMVKNGVVIIDVGINLSKEGSYVGDVDYQGCFDMASAITPVPGGIGSITTTILMQNIVRACKVNRFRE